MVTKGEIICVAETTKASFEIETDHDGYFFPLAEVSTKVKIGNPLAVVTLSEKDSLKSIKKWLLKTVQKNNINQSKKNKTYTKKAMILANRLGFDINSVSVTGGKITEKDVLSHYDEFKISGKLIKTDVMDLIDDIYTANKMEKVLIIGGGDGAVQILDVIRASQTQRAIGIVDDNTKLKGKTVVGVPSIGKIDAKYVSDLYKEGRFDSAIISISTNIAFRDKVFDDFSKKGIPFTNIIHPTSYVGLNVSLGTGNVILAFCQIGACAKIENNNFLSAYTNIEHHNMLGNSCSFGPGVLTSSSVKIGDKVKFGTGIFVEPFVKIGSNSTIASGSILTGNIPDGHIVKSRVNTFVRPK
jgi:sugar O-acyltransferase (sialic acid O-acetyltransferase NeuD family)